MQRATRTSRRLAVLSFLGSTLTMTAQDVQDPDLQNPNRSHLPHDGREHEDDRLPNGKSQRDAIAESDHKQALKDAQSLVDLATSIQQDVEKAGSYVVPLSTVKKTEEMEKLARHLRSRLKG